MRLLSRLATARVAVAVLTVITGLQILLVTIGNITDYDTNWAFVRHVLAMDTTFRSPHMMWRAITNPGLATTAYVLIIIWEGLTSLVLIAACVNWVRTLFGHRDSDVARRLSALGWLMELTLFAGGFLAVGGEYFQMWQSAKWNGIQSALEYVTVSAIGLLLAHIAARPART